MVKLEVNAKFWKERKYWVWQGRYNKLAFSMGIVAIINIIVNSINENYFLMILNLIILAIIVWIMASYSKRDGNYAGGTDGTKGTV